MKVVVHPKVQEIDLPKVLHALSDPVRLRLVRTLAVERDLTCGALCLGRPKSSMSHHFKIMIDAGLLRVDVVGNAHRNSLRLEEMNGRFPGLLAAVLGATDSLAQKNTKPGLSKNQRGKPVAKSVLAARSAEIGVNSRPAL